MTPSRPYLIRALNEWILDNNCTPYVVVNADLEGVNVPEQYVKDGQIVLNISPGAVRNFAVSNEAVEFSARFGGVPTQVYVPIVAVLAIYARENGQGMVFGMEAGAPDPNNPPVPDGSSKSNKSSKPSLKIVK